MTTIAYRDGMLAADTQTSFSGIRCADQRKIHREGRLLTGFSGTSTNYERFRSWVRDGMSGDFDSRGGNVFILPPSGPAVIWGDGDYPWREPSEFWALGSGEHLALGAMSAGATAEEAVRIAMRWDNATGGEITVLRR